MGDGAIGCNWGTGERRKPPATANPATYRHRAHPRLYRKLDAKTKGFRGREMTFFGSMGMDLAAITPRMFASSPSDLDENDVVE
jgi:hypothetical protein